MNARVDHIEGVTFHGRKGAVANAFRYSVDYVLLDAEADLETPALFSRNARNLTGLDDKDHGGTPKQGRGAIWVREILTTYGVSDASKVELLAQPKMLGYVFNPVSFWLCRREDGALIAVISEVTNTYGDRHSYLCCHDDLRPIEATDRLVAQKFMHVSPFQPVEGGYEFRFDITDTRIGIWIDYSRGNGGLIATLTGKRAPMTNRSIVRFALLRPMGARRVMALIHWQALKLWFKKATFRSPPKPPSEDVSKGWSSPHGVAGE
ncbi:MAG: DUF1365 domain-containing protein [Aliishimia sp.]